MAAVHRHVIVAGGPALRFNNALHADGSRASIPVLINLFGTQERVAAAMGCKREQVPALGEMLASLRHQPPLSGARDAIRRWPAIRAALSAQPRRAGTGASQDVVREAPDVDLHDLPVQTCWPGEPAPLITWPVVITRPWGGRADAVHTYNAGIYRMQVLDRDRAVIRWLAQRGGAAHYREWTQAGTPMPVAVALGADPALLLAAALPLPADISEVSISGVLRGARTRLVPARSIPMLVPADAEIVLEGWTDPSETAPEGPFGDHTGYYNAIERFPVLRISAVTHRHAPIYLSTFTARAPDEPSIIGEVFIDLALPTIKRQIPELEDLWLPPEACSYRIAIAVISKRYPGQARRVMMALWGMLPQFSYTKLIIVVDTDINPRDWSDVAWALATRMDPSRDLMRVDHTPMDYMDFASPEAGLAGKLGIDATIKIGAETKRDWGQAIAASPQAEAFAAQLCSRLGLGGTA